MAPISYRYLKPFLSLFCVALLLLGWGLAQTVEDPDDLPELALGSIEILGGWPGFQLFGLRFSVQVETFGVALSGSLTGMGPYLSLAGRYYLPLPIPVPTYASLGAGLFSRDPVLFATLGAHIPLTRSLRLTLEGGVSRVVVFDQAQFLPYASVALGYTFAFEPQALSPNPVAAGASGAGAAIPACQPGPPDEGALGGAFARELRLFIAEARVVYAGVYRDLSYHYEITSADVSGQQGRVVAAYEGSVTEVLTGNRLSASGTIVAEFLWDGCGWRLQSYTY